jgi:uncharacterized protein YqjF (DUF2071 family)
VPKGTELDLWEGRCFVSVVGFHFRNTRVLGLPIPFHRNFEEVNLRFYVRRRVGEAVRRGVVFVKELVPRAAIAWTARALYNENYVAVPMSHEVRLDANGAGAVAYRWGAEPESSLAVTATGAGAPPEPGSGPEFITEHYWGYVRQRDGSTVEYQVEHPRWRVWRASGAVLLADVATLYGSEFSRALAAPPSSAFLADGSPVVVHRGRRL